MMPARPLVAATLAVLLAGPALAADDAAPSGSSVTAVQPPAWLIHDGQELALSPGIVVHEGDRLRTAGGGRVYLALPEQSTVKIGADSEFAVAAMQTTSDSQGSLFKGALQLLKGVFRFTTSLQGKLQRRDVQIRVATATIGIRGTDVWGRAGSDGGLVALLEGHISMDLPGHAGLKMDEPLRYMTLAGDSMTMDQVVTPAKVADWAAQTDVHPGTGVLSTGGHWTLALLASPAAGDVQGLMTRLATAGYPSRDLVVNHRGHPWHRLVMQSIASYRDARVLTSRLRALDPHLQPWILSEPTGLASN